MFDWLKGTLGHKADHPMHDAAAAAALLAELPENNTKALEEIGNWLDTVARTGDFPAADRIAVVNLLDDAGQARERTMVPAFLGDTAMKEFDRLQLWQALVDFWERLASAYRVCLGETAPAPKPEAPPAPERVILVVRAMRALANEMKILQFRYLPARPALWHALSELYILAERENMCSGTLKAYLREAVPTNPRLELLRPLMLDLANPETELPQHLELAARIVARLASGFAFSLEPAPECNLCFDLARPDRPVHCAPELAHAPTRRYFGVGRVHAALTEIIERHTTHPKEPERRFGDDFPNEEKLLVMKHLLLHWGEKPPRRREPRVKINVHMALAHGFSAACELVTRVEFSGMAEITENQRVRLREQTGLALEAKATNVPLADWVEHDAAKWGLGVDVPRQDEPWARIGTLCAFQPAGLKTWWIGVIRRLYRDERDHEHAGIEILAKKPLSVWLRGIGEGAQRAENWATSSGSFEFTYAPALILGESATSGRRQELLVTRDSFIPGIEFEVMMGEKMPHVRYDELLERGADYDRVGVTWLKAA